MREEKEHEEPAHKCGRRESPEGGKVHGVRCPGGIEAEEEAAESQGLARQTSLATAARAGLVRGAEAPI